MSATFFTPEGVTLAFIFFPKKRKPESVTDSGRPKINVITQKVVLLRSRFFATNKFYQLIAKNSMTYKLARVQHALTCRSLSN